MRPHTASPAGIRSYPRSRQTRASTTTPTVDRPSCSARSISSATPDTRIAAFDWTGLKALDSGHCNACSSIQFGGQLFSGVEDYYGEGFIAPQKAGPIPLGDECVTAGADASPPFPVDNNTATSCPENGIATNGDGMTQVAQAPGSDLGRGEHRGRPVVHRRDESLRCTKRPRTG